MRTGTRRFQSKQPPRCSTEPTRPKMTNRLYLPLDEKTGAGHPQGPHLRPAPAAKPTHSPDRGCQTTVAAADGAQQRLEEQGRRSR
jgi:hypothetical protein